MRQLHQHPDHALRPGSLCPDPAGHFDYPDALAKNTFSLYIDPHDRYSELGVPYDLQVTSVFKLGFCHGCVNFAGRLQSDSYPDSGRHTETDVGANTPTDDGTNNPTDGHALPGADSTAIKRTDALGHAEVRTSTALR